MVDDLIDTNELCKRVPTLTKSTLRMKRYRQRSGAKAREPFPAPIKDFGQYQIYSWSQVCDHLSLDPETGKTLPTTELTANQLSILQDLITARVDKKNLSFDNRQLRAIRRKLMLNA